MFVINTVTISGNLTRDPELRSTPSGTPVCQFGVAVNERVKQGDTWEDRPSFIDVTAWASLAEQVAKQASKGSLICVMGQLRQDRWEKDGDKRSKTYVVARAFVVPKGDSNGQPSTGGEVPADTDFGSSRPGIDDSEIPFT